jgi:hypothetical protein
MAVRTAMSGRCAPDLKRDTLMFMKSKLASAVIISGLLSSPAMAEKETGMGYGLSGAQCAATTKLLKNAIGELTILSYVSGYLSAMNTFSEERDVAHGRLTKSLSAFANIAESIPRPPARPRFWKS